MKRLLIFLVMIVSVLASAADLQISWSPNTEIDLAGYNVSYDGPSSTRWTTPCDPYEVSSQGVIFYTTQYTVSDAAAGDYAIYVRAYDQTGNMSDCDILTGNLSAGGVWTTEGVTAPATCYPEASFTASPDHGTAPYTVTLTDTSTGSPVSWEWCIDLTVFATTQDTTYEITDLENKHVRLRVWNDNWFDDAYYTIMALQPTMQGCSLQGGGN